MSNPAPNPTPQTTTKKPIIIISTIVGLVLLSIVAGVVVYQSKMTETKMTSKSSSSVMSQMTASTSAKMKTFIKDGFPDFKMSYPENWQASSDEYTKEDTLKFDGKELRIGLIQSFATGLSGGLTCYDTYTEITNDIVRVTNRDLSQMFPDGMIQYFHKSDIHKKDSPEYAKAMERFDDVASMYRVEDKGKFAACGAGIYLAKTKTTLPKNQTDQTNEGWLDIRVNNNLTKEQINQADEMVKSIKSLYW
ncbi:MAG: hypothetical protein H7230_01875 [Candidatus Parcubacteria bacterium]|nr:hypothetical protein [Candidatus Paceibacterota bacterium]